jgi:hypothetical protein
LYVRKCDEERRGKGKRLDFHDTDKVEHTFREYKKGTMSSAVVEKGLRTGGFTRTMWNKEMVDDIQEHGYMSMTSGVGGHNSSIVNLVGAPSAHLPPVSPPANPRTDTETQLDQKRLIDTVKRGSGEEGYKEAHSHNEETENNESTYKRNTNTQSVLHRCSSV